MKSFNNFNTFTLPPDNHTWKNDEFAANAEQFKFRKAFKAFIEHRHEVLLYRFKMMKVDFDLQIMEVIYSFLREENVLYIDNEMSDLPFVLLNTPSLNFQQVKMQHQRGWRPIWQCWKSFDFPQVTDLYQGLQKDPIHCLVEPPPKLSTIATPRTPPLPMLFEIDATSASPPPAGLLQSYFTPTRVLST